MPRLLFEKKGRAVWISHLDLMRLFQRAFKRAGLKLKHTQGFNPRPSVSIALPLSVGVESECELLDFDLDGDPVSNEDVCRRLNDVLVEGVRAKQVYDGGKKVGLISFLECCLNLEYDDPVSEDVATQIGQLFQRTSLVLPKKTKSGIQDQDIIPMIRRIHIKQTDAHIIQMNAMICCQNPTLNPAQLVAAIETYLPACRPDFSKCCRIEIYDGNETVFR